MTSIPLIYLKDYSRAVLKNPQAGSVDLFNPLARLAWTGLFHQQTTQNRMKRKWRAERWKPIYFKLREVKLWRRWKSKAPQSNTAATAARARIKAYQVIRWINLHSWSSRNLDSKKTNGSQVQNKEDIGEYEIVEELEQKEVKPH